MNNTGITPYNRNLNVVVNVASLPPVTFEEYSDGTVLCNESSSFTEEQVKAICKDPEERYAKHLRAAMIGQWVYGREKMIEVYADMKKIKEGSIYAFNLKDFCNEREGWYNCFEQECFDSERNVFDKEKCFKKMQKIHQMYIDIDKCNRRQTESSPNQFFHRAISPVYKNKKNNNNDTNNNNSVDLDEVKKPPRKRQKTQPNKDIHLKLHNNTADKNLANEIGVNTINRLPNHQTQPNSNYDLLSPTRALQANQAVDNNNNNKVDFDAERNSLQKKKKAQTTLHYQYTDKKLTKDNASIYRSVYRGGIFGIINGIENSYNGDLSWITIRWDDGSVEKILSTPYCLREIYLTTLKEVKYK